MINLGNVLILGDSYSTFDGFIPEGFASWYHNGGHENTDVSEVSDTWWHKVIESTESELVLNSSYSGTTICHTGYGGEDRSNISFTARAIKLIEEGFFKENKIDTVLVFGGTNDSWAGSPVGENMYSDWEKQDLYSVLPAFCYLMHRLKTDTTGARIINIINTELKQEIALGLTSASKKYGVEHLQLCDIGKTGGHPNKQGMSQIAEQLLNFLEQSK